jgi:hypothetical protein
LRWVRRLRWERRLPRRARSSGPLKPRPWGENAFVQMFGALGLTVEIVTEPITLSKDNARVPGHDNAHGDHHRHDMVSVEAGDPVSQDDRVERFQTEWAEIVNQVKG